MLFLLLACTAELPADSGADRGTTDPSPEELVVLLGAPGPHGVGYTEQNLSTTDPAGQARALRLAVWYPTADTEGEAPTYLGFVEAPGVLRDARPEPGPFPVVAFSHGSQGYAEVSGFLMAHLASHGFVVASPDHSGNTIRDDGERSTEIYFQRPADMRAVVDHLQAGGWPQADTSTLVGIGHSFGGYTLMALAGADYAIEEIAPACYDGSDSSEFCSTMSPAYEALFAAGFADPRFDAILPMGAGDAALFQEGVTQIDVPGLWLAGELDGANAQAISVFEQVQGGPSGQGLHRRGEVLGAAHNFCIDLTAALDLDATIDDEEGFRIARVLGLAWALRHGPGDRSVDPILDGEVPISDALRLYR